MCYLGVIVVQSYIQTQKEARRSWLRSQPRPPQAEADSGLLPRPRLSVL